MKGYLIDPELRNVSEIQLKSDDVLMIKQMHTLIGAATLDSARITHDGDYVWVDDEGLMKVNHLFSIEGYGNPLAGKAVVIGSDELGATRAPRIKLPKLKSRLTWLGWMRAPDG